MKNKTVNVFMKRLLTFLLVVLAFAVQGQNSAVTKAETKFNSGKIEEALELITPALTHEKSVDKGKTWYVNGIIQKAIALADSLPDLQALSPNALEDAISSFNKVFELEKESSGYHFSATNEMAFLWEILVNKGADAFADDASVALDYFMKSKMVRPTDSISLLYSGVAAQSSDKYELAIDNYNEFIEAGYKNEEIYRNKIKIYMLALDDKEAALESTREAIEAYPDNEEFKSTEIQLLVELEMIEDAITKVEEAIETDSENENLYYSLGYMYDVTEDKDKAKANYAKAVEIKPEFFEANVNLAIIYYNEAVVIYKELNGLPMAEYQKRKTAMESEAGSMMEKSLPYWLKAHELQPENTTIIENLQNVYVRLKKMDLAEEMRKKLEALEGNN